MAMKKAVKKAAPKKATAKSKAAPAKRSTTAAKYEQPGAPWWKRVPAPPAKQ